MVDYRAQLLFRHNRGNSIRKIDAVHLARIRATAARSYSDDIDIRSGALSAPCDQMRPGQRDDADCGNHAMSFAL